MEALSGAARWSAAAAGTRSETWCFHRKFGYGAITAVQDNKLAIWVEHASDKNVLDAYVEHA